MHADAHQLLESDIHADGSLFDGNPAPHRTGTPKDQLGIIPQSSPYPLPFDPAVPDLLTQSLPLILASISAHRQTQPFPKQVAVLIADGGLIGFPLKAGKFLFLFEMNLTASAAYHIIDCPPGLIGQILHDRRIGIFLKILPIRRRHF